MADLGRINDLRRRVRKDPASIAFGQLAEELRRAGWYSEAVTVCRTGLTSHPEYHSARVTLGRALIALDQLDEAERELKHVQASSRENLVAVRALEEIEARRAEEAGLGAKESNPDSCGDQQLRDTGQHALEVDDTPVRVDPTAHPVEYRRMVRTVAALESWLTAIYVTRADRRP